MTDLAVEILGEGDTVVLVHGSGVRDWTWSDQRAFAERYRVVMPYRRGYGDSPAADPDFEVDAEDVAALLERPLHLLGFSYGGIGALLAAAKRPELVRSVTVVEPPAFGVAAANPAVADLVSRLHPLVASAPELTPDEYGAAFAEVLGFEPRPADDPQMRSALDSFRRERPPDEASIPFDRLDGVPVLVVSGGWHPAFEAVCDAIAARLGARREVLPGAGHGAQHAPGFNDLLEAFWREAA